jgi:hypothetical protein
MNQLFSRYPWDSGGLGYHMHQIINMYENFRKTTGKYVLSEEHINNHFVVYSWYHAYNLTFVGKCSTSSKKFRSEQCIKEWVDKIYLTSFPFYYCYNNITYTRHKNIEQTDWWTRYRLGRAQAQRFISKNNSIRYRKRTRLDGGPYTADDKIADQFILDARGIHTSKNVKWLAFLQPCHVQQLISMRIYDPHVINNDNHI